MKQRSYKKPNETLYIYEKDIDRERGTKREKDRKRVGTIHAITRVSMCV